MTVVDDGDTTGGAAPEVLVQVVDVDPGRMIGWGTNAAQRLEDRIGDLRAAIMAGGRTVAESVDTIDSPGGWGLDEVSASFGVTLTAEAGVLLTKASGEATFEVTLTFKRRDDDTGRQPAA